MPQAQVRFAMVMTTVLLAASAWFVCLTASEPPDRGKWIWLRSRQPEWARRSVTVQRVLDWLDPPDPWQYGGY